MHPILVDFDIPFGDRFDAVGVYVTRDGHQVVCLGGFIN
jgi:hypothetical protein